MWHVVVNHDVMTFLQIFMICQQRSHCSWTSSDAFFIFKEQHRTSTLIEQQESRRAYCTTDNFDQSELSWVILPMMKEMSHRIKHTLREHWLTPTSCWSWVILLSEKGLYGLSTDECLMDDATFKHCGLNRNVMVSATK